MVNLLLLYLYNYLINLVNTDKKENKLLSEWLMENFPYNSQKDEHCRILNTHSNTKVIQNKKDFISGQTKLSILN